MDLLVPDDDCSYMLGGEGQPQDHEREGEGESNRKQGESPAVEENNVSHEKRQLVATIPDDSLSDTYHKKRRTIIGFVDNSEEPKQNNETHSNIKDDTVIIRRSEDEHGYALSSTFTPLTGLLDDTNVDVVSIGDECSDISSIGSHDRSMASSAECSCTFEPEADPRTQRSEGTTQDNESDNMINIHRKRRKTLLNKNKDARDNVERKSEVEGKLVGDDEEISDGKDPSCISPAAQSLKDNTADVLPICDYYFEISNIVPDNKKPLPSDLKCSLLLEDEAERLARLFEEEDIAILNNLLA